jgi:hypothetical protein
MRTFYIFGALFIVSLGLIQGIRPGQASDQIPKEVGQKADLVNQSSSLEEQIPLKIYHLFYAEDQEVWEKDDTWLKAFLRDLDEIDKKGGYDGDPETLVICRAEIYLRLGRVHQALVEFFRFKSRPGNASHDLMPMAQRRLDQTLAQIRSGDLVLDQEQITRDVFDLLFKKRRENVAFDDNKLRALLEVLNILEADEKFKGDRNTLLYLRAESLFRMNEHKDAYVAFYRLKLRLGSRNHPLFTDVEKRIEIIQRQIKAVKKAPDLRGKPNDFVVPAVIISILFIYLLGRDAQKATDRKDKSAIIHEEKLITLGDMREQDGRCSSDTMEEYQNQIKDTGWDSLSPEEQDKYKFARLVYKGHGMICSLNTKPPHTIALISHIPGLNCLPPYWQYSVVGFGFALIWWIIGDRLALCESKSVAIYLFLGAFAVACLSSVKIMSQKTIDALDELVSMLEPANTRESITKLCTWVGDLFRSPRKLYFGLVVMSILIYSFHIKNKFILESGRLNLDILFSGVLVLISCEMIWFLTGSLFFMHKLYKLKDLSMNPLSPSKTMGLEKMIGVIGSYNILVSLVSSMGCAIALFSATEDGYSPAYGALWFFFIAPILIFYWVYPYVKLGALVKSKKINRMNFVKTKIALLFDDWKRSEDKLLKIMEDEKCRDSSSEDPKESVKAEKDAIDEKLKDMDRYYEIFKKIEQSPESYFNLSSVLELAKAMGIPSLFALMAAMFSMYGG